MLRKTLFQSKEAPDRKFLLERRKDSGRLLWALFKLFLFQEGSRQGGEGQGHP